MGLYDNRLRSHLPKHIKMLHDTPSGVFVLYNIHIHIRGIMGKTERLINRIKEVDNFENVAYVCEDFETFVIEVAEWGVDHIAQVDFDDPELNIPVLDAFFASFGCTPSNPHPAGRYA